MRGEVHILVYCPIDTLQWGSTHSAVIESSLTASQVKGEATILKKLLPRPDLTSFLLYASL